MHRSVYNTFQSFMIMFPNKFFAIQIVNFEQVKTIANVSLSQKQHFFSAEVHHLDLKIIGCQSALKYDVMCSHFVPRFLWLPSRVLILVSNSSNVPIKDKSVWRIKLVHLLNDFC